MISGILVVKNQQETVRMSLESVADICDKILIFDNRSTDSTLKVIEDTVDENNLDAKIEVKDGFFWDLYREGLQRAEGHTLRIEGDQVFFRQALREAADLVEPDNTVFATSYLVKNRYDLRPKGIKVNAPHPTIYGSKAPIDLVENAILPRGGEPVFYNQPVSINCRVNSPLERLKRPYRPRWWRQVWRDVEPEYTLYGVGRPYCNYISLEDYIKALLDQNGQLCPRGMCLEGETLEEMAEDYVKKDIEQNCIPYKGPYPEVLQEHMGLPSKGSITVSYDEKLKERLRDLGYTI